MTVILPNLLHCDPFSKYTVGAPLVGARFSCLGHPQGEPLHKVFTFYVDYYFESH